MHARIHLNLSSIPLILLCGFYLSLELSTVKAGFLDETEQLIELEENIDPIQFKSPFLIQPFNDTILHNEEYLKGSVFFKEIGRIRLATDSSQPSFFPASFSLFSRNGSLKDLQLDWFHHRVTMSSQSEDDDNTNVIPMNYHFNLAHLRDNNPFDLKKRTLIVVSGYLTEKLVPWSISIKDKWLQLEDINVLLVHWDKGCFTTYAKAAGSRNLVARQVVILMYYLAQLQQIDFLSPEFLDRVSVVGHSLGAHIAGAIGEEFYGKIDRITGLDPAGVIFDRASPEDRLSQGDAKLVDIIHTNGGRMKYLKAGYGVLKTTAKSLLKKLYSYNNEVAVSVLNQYGSDDNLPWYGMEMPIGDLDYYPNGGSIQPGCDDDLHLCDHGRATKLYISGLEYELKSRLLHGKDSELIRHKRHRFVAFPSADYEKFKSGTDLLRNCPNLLISKEKLDSKQREENYRRCTIPLDFTSTGRDFAKELREDYGLRIEDDDKRRLYFDTTNTEPYLNEHYILRVELDHSKSLNKWQKGCRFTALMNSYTQLDTRSIVDYSLPTLSMVSDGNFHGFTLPFVSLNPWRISVPGSLKHPIIPSDCESECIDNLMTNVPYYMKIGTGYDPKTSTIKRVVSSLSNIFGFSGEKGRENTCRISIKSIEIRPLVVVKSGLSAWYDKEGSQGEGPKLITQPELSGYTHESPVLLDWQEQRKTYRIAAIGVDDENAATS